ncbi:endonuclease/exonuclease/phosphatase family protein [Candidatus Saccharibacteria bacterium]|nr:endonuclease/exonuclease/phosphatase family protein [Candidatus Saccharibacteria bacterium]
MKLLQVNVWMGRLTRQLLPLIEQVQPDIITAQEVFSSSQAVPFPDTTFNVFELMQKAGGYTHSYFSPIGDFNYSGVSVGVGNGVLSRYPLVSTETIFTNGSFQANADVSIFESNVRNAQFVTVQLPEGQTLYVVNHHAYWQPNPVGDEKTVASMQKVFDTLRTIDGPVIFAGDMNVDPGTPAMQLFDGVLDDLTGTHEVTNTMSSLGKLQGVAPDHILVGPEVHVRDFRVLEDLVSDHQALLLEFDLE